MRLINLETLEIEEFMNPPPYAILSHTWFEGEVTFQDVSTLSPEMLATRPGWRKVVDFCATARAHTHRLLSGTKAGTGMRTEAGPVVRYGWVDTCCIDKTSSAELSEAINSMFQWYRAAVACFAFLEDDRGGKNFETCRWFKRGWTLQELLAPRHLFFFDGGWNYIGDRHEWAGRIAYITAIFSGVVETGEWDGCCVAERMAWAARRTTTRAEDMAYCLMGLFDVNMPLLYGEGGEKAFVRLQEEILKESEDQSIFAWDASRKDGNEVRQVGALATSPSLFVDGGAIETIPPLESQIVLTAKGVQAPLPIITRPAGRGATNSGSGEEVLALLACRFEADMDSIVGIPVQEEGRGGQADNMYLISTAASRMQVYSRLPRPPVPVIMSPTAPRQVTPTVCLIKRDQRLPTVPTPPRKLKCWLCYGALRGQFGPSSERRHIFGWRVSAGGTMTRLLARQVKTLVVPFVRSGTRNKGEESVEEESVKPSFCVVVIIRPEAVVGDRDSGGSGGGSGLRVSLVGLQGKMDADDSLDRQMARMLADTDSLVEGQQAELIDVATGHTIRANAAILEGGSIFQVILTMQRARPG